MGLDTTHDCWHGGYGVFNMWRHAIAEAIDVPLDLMDGFYDKHSPIQIAVENSPQWVSESLTKNILPLLPIYWDILKPDPIYILLHHSDCDGTIELQDQLPIAQRLEEIAEKLPLQPFDMKERARKFAAGLRLANSLGEVVEFG